MPLFGPKAIRPANDRLLLFDLQTTAVLSFPVQGFAFHSEESVLASAQAGSRPQAPSQGLQSHGSAFRQRPTATTFPTIRTTAPAKSHGDGISRSGAEASPGRFLRRKCSLITSGKLSSGNVDQRTRAFRDLGRRPQTRAPSSRNLRRSFSGEGAFRRTFSHESLRNEPVFFFFLSVCGDRRVKRPSGRNPFFRSGRSNRLALSA
jgi:hypothetical protein